MFRKLVLSSAIAALSLGAAPAIADGASRVTWQPASSGSCEDCKLVGRQMPFWNLENARYNGANLSYSSLHATQADGAYFNNIVAHHTDFSRAQLHNAQFTGASLTQARLIGIQANGANFAGAHMDYSDTREAIMIGVNLSDVSAVHMLALGADFSAANCTKAIFDKATLRGAVFNGALLSDASFIEADLAGASFQDARFAGANLARAINYQEADFTGACRSAATQLPPGLELRSCDEIQASTRALPEAP